jgi:hypothetical protein
VTLERGLGPSEAHRVLTLAECLPEAPDAMANVLRRLCAQ